MHHITDYEYGARVVSGHTIAHLKARSTPFQRVISSVVTTDPVADHSDEHFDSFGNVVSYFAFERNHRHLRVESISEVEVVVGTLPSWSGAWDSAATAIAAESTYDALLARICSQPSPMVDLSDALVELARPSFPVGRPLHECIMELTRRINQEFTFDPGVTDVATPLSDVLAARRGVCQDFAHLGIGCLRSLGLSARYVSGYIETEPLEGFPRLVGADASHAWLSVYIPGFGWLDADPTNDQVPPNRHVTVAWGRDYGDVAPVRGVAFGPPATQQLSVSVDVARL